MASELCMNCFSVKGQFEVCPYCGYVEGTPPAQPHCLTPGTILGNHFIVGTVIGFGGFGITYKCFDTTLGIVVAAKEFYPMGLVNRSPGESKVGLLSGEKREQYKAQLKRFVMEAQSVAQFGKAKDIVNVYDFFEENGTAYMIMEYINGILLKDYLEKQGPMPPDVAMSVIMPIIEAVKKIHSKGIIHRDISPDNIFITDEKSIKVFDFGAAQLNHSKEGMAGEKVIKVGYSAPEQYRDNSKQDFCTDIYSVGAIMYQLLTGRKPIESTSREYKDKLKSPLELGIKVNSNVDRAVMEALAVKPELRYQGIQQFEDALRNKRVAEYPKEKIRKQKRKRNWIIVSALTVTLAVGVSIFLAVNGIGGKKEEIFKTYLSSGTSITVWVENEDQKSQLDDLVKHGFKNEEGTVRTDGMNKADRKKWETFWEENEGISVEVKVVPDIEKSLATVSENELPNMYITDHVSEEQKEKTSLVSLDTVYDSVSGGYAVDIRKAGNKEIPTGIDTLLLYDCTIDYNQDNTLAEGSAIEKKSIKTCEPENIDGVKVETVELNDLISDGSAGDTETIEGLLSDKAAVFDKSVIIPAVYTLEEKDWDKFFEKTVGFNPQIKDLSHIQQFNNVAMVPDYSIGHSEEYEGPEVYGGVIVAGTAYRKVLDEAMKASSGKKNPIKKYKTYIVTHEDKMILIYSERYGVTNGDESKVNACQRLLYMMMDTIGQHKKITNGSATTLPIRSEQLNKFEEISRNMAGFIKKLERDGRKGEIISELTGDMYRFIGLIGVTENEDEIRKICSDYVKSEGSENGGDNTENTGEEVTEESQTSETADNVTPTEESASSLTDILKGIDE